MELSTYSFELLNNNGNLFELKKNINETNKKIEALRQAVIDGITHQRLIPQKIKNADSIFIFKEQVVIGQQSLNEMQLNESLIKLLHAYHFHSSKKRLRSNRARKQLKRDFYPGKYRQCNVVWHLDNRDYASYFVDHDYVDKEMQDYQRWLEKHINHEDPLMLAFLAHYNFYKIHPFLDGNGRVAGTLLNLILLKNNYVNIVFNIRNDKEFENFHDLFAEALSGEILPFIEYLAQQLLSRENYMLDYLQRLNSSN